jgi:hypothetical protein
LLVHLFQAISVGLDAEPRNSPEHLSEKVGDGTDVEELDEEGFVAEIVDAKSCSLSSCDVPFRLAAFADWLRAHEELR